MKRSAFSNITKDCWKRKISLLFSVNYLVQQGKKYILSYNIPPGTNWYALLQLQLLKIHFYHKSHNRGTYIARVRRPTLFSRVMHRTIFREIHKIRGANAFIFTLEQWKHRAISYIYLQRIYQWRITRNWTVYHNCNNFSHNYEGKMPDVSIFALQFQYGYYMSFIHKFIFKPLHYVSNNRVRLQLFLLVLLIESSC